MIGSCQSSRTTNVPNSQAMRKRSIKMKENRTKEPKSDKKKAELTLAPEVLVIKERKIDLQAKNAFEISQLEHTSDHFLLCKIREEIEFFEFTYDVAGQKPISQLPSKDWAARLSALIQLQQILTKESAYQIPMEPDNFYSDEQGVVRVLKRDLQMTELVEEEQLKAFQALAGTMLQGKYSFDELYSGGIELLKENDRTKSFTEWQNLAEAYEDLLKKQRDFKAVKQKTTKSVKKVPNLIMKIALIIFSITTVVVSGLYIYQTFWLIPPEEKALIAERAFIEKDYVQVIEALQDIPVESLAKPEKYVLAVSYIRSQSIDTFSHEAKELILSKIVPNGTEIVMDYWIYLGRLDANSAEEIAMSLSDNQLLLYAYLQEMDNVSHDKELEGTAKAEKLNTLEGKIKGIADKLGIEYDEKQQQSVTDETVKSSSTKESSQEPAKETNPSKKE